GIGSTEVFADWVTSPENPRFTTVIANRMWRRIMGVGVIEPVDDLRDDTAPSDPALQRELERLIEDLGYDLREFQRVLLHTDLWQREAAALSPDAPGGAAFVGPALRRLTAEQLWDSLVTLVVPDVDATLDPPDAGARAVYDEFERARQMTDQDLEERLRVEMLRLTDRKQYLRERSERRAEARAEGRRARTLAKRLSRARQRGREERAETLFAELLATGRTAAEIEQMLRG